MDEHRPCSLGQGYYSYLPSRFCPQGYYFYYLPSRFGPQGCYYDYLPSRFCPQVCYYYYLPSRFCPQGCYYYHLTSRCRPQGCYYYLPSRFRLACSRLLLERCAKESARGQKRGGNGGEKKRERRGACNHFLKHLMPVYQLPVYLLIGQF